jgi:hypothetical protein
MDGGAMTTTHQYDQLLNDLAAGQLEPIQKQILDALRRAYPAAVSREDLAVAVFGGNRPADISRDVRDRKNRLAIQGLRELGIPIISSSREAGYRLDVSMKALDAMQAENSSRIERLRDRNNAIERARQKIRAQGINAIPSTAPRAEKAKQPSLWVEYLPFQKKRE